MRVVLGNRDAITSPDNGETWEKLPRGKRATTVEIPDELDAFAAVTAITHPSGVWAHHAAEGAKPAWVAAEDPGFASLLAAAFGGDVEIRDLED